ncbi:MAG: hypothetical protein MJE68_24910, partial [Proteobacteria bacterium]|nr:hypothetical protein [Pseudomonadota bacterium]
RQRGTIRERGRGEGEGEGESSVFDVFHFVCFFFRFVEEHRHEWGERVGGGGEVSPLEAAPRRWRLALANKNTGAFQGWKVITNTQFSVFYDQNSYAFVAKWFCP